MNISNYEVFDDIADPTLRAYNRFTVAMNISEDVGEAGVAMYLGRFTEADRKAIAIVAMGIRKNGLEATKKQIQQKVREELNKYPDVVNGEEEY